jgi:hypothetical protein
MMAFLFGPIGRLIGGGLAVLALVAGIYFAGSSAGKRAEVKRTAPIIANLQAAVDSWKAAAQQWQAAVHAQNAAIEALQAAQEAKQAEAGRVLAKAPQQRAKARKTADDILGAELRGDTLERYERADRMIVERLGE